MTRLSVQLYSVRDQFAADPLATLQRLAGIGFTDVEPYGLVQNLDALRDGLPQTPLSAPTAHVSLVGADLDAVFAAAVACGIGVVIEPAVREPVDVVPGVAQRLLGPVRLVDGHDHARPAVRPQHLTDRSLHDAAPAGQDRHPVADLLHLPEQV